MKRGFQGIIVGAAIATSAPAAWAGDVCISEQAQQSLNACVGVGPMEFDVGKHGKTPTVNFHSAPPPADLKKRDQQVKPNAPTVTDSPRDERKSRLQARQRALLVTEIQQTESLFRATRANSPDRPQLARRLAEQYVELESAAFRDKTEAEIKRDDAKKRNPQQAGQLQTNANQAEAVMKAARRKAIDFYTIIIKDYPNYPNLDEVLYYLAYEYEQANDLKNARTAYYDLIKKRPDSKYIPHAYLAFGELFFNEAQGDPSKWDYAAQAYSEVIKYPPPNNRVYGYAWYKLAYVYWNKNELEKALNAFKKTIEFGSTFTQLPGAAKLADAARRDIIPVYAVKGDPAQAYSFMRSVSGDPAGSNEKTFKMMDELGTNYLDTGHYPEAIVLYRDLIARDKSGRHCVYQAHITEATMAMKGGNKDAVIKEIDNQLRVANQFKNSSYSAEQKAECANTSAALITETAMSWHLEAVGSPGQHGTRDKRTMGLAAELYRRIVDTWSAEEFQTFTFPRILKEDWPTIYKIKYAMADLLWAEENWEKCGPAFDAVVAANPQGPEAAEAAFASVLCYQKLYDQAHAGDAAKRGAGNLPGQKKDEKAKNESERLRPKEMSDTQKGMVQAFNRYICYIKPAANDTAGKNQLVEVKYARARTYFEAQHWEEAAAGFREIAMNDVDREDGIYAAQLYLESINVLGSHFQKTSCFDDMERDVPKFIELYCKGDRAQKNAEQCTLLNKIEVDILRLKAQKLVERADKEGGKEALGMYEKAGAAYFETFRKYCEEPVKNNRPPQAERCDEIAYNAARSFQAARLVAKAIFVRQALIDFDKRQNMNSPLAKKAVYEIGANNQAIAVYDLAADWYERYAKMDPRAPNADQALSDAVILRLGLGQEEQAIENAKIFMKNYGGSKPAQTASIAFAVGAHYADREEWEKAKNALVGSMGVIGKAAPDVQVQAHATLGRAYSHIKRYEPLAKTEYARVRALWSDPLGAAAKIRDAYPNEDTATKDRRLARALDAVGEAYFFAAEERRRAEVDKLKFPVYTGPGDKTSVLRHVESKVRDWYLKKKAAIEKVEPDYIKILDLKPTAPPKWVIAAGSRAGLMWGDFVDDFRRAPIPEAWKKDAEIRGTYYEALDRASEPFKVNNAKPALKKCLDLSVRFQYFDEFSRSCEVWLAKNYKSEFHVIDELRGAPTLSNSGLDEKAPPILTDGTFWRPTAAAPEKTTVSTELANDSGSAASSGGGNRPRPRAGGGGRRQGGHPGTNRQGGGLP
ncbi:MAG: tetratricopeptide repeat protein [Polyangiaceae bacterium]|nr:tetratricopeptide repeat protein [Polyangiaceae bacterium]